MIGMQKQKAWEAISFPVALEPVFTAKGEEVPNRKAVVRQDTRGVLNVVSDRYKLVPHADVFAPVAEALDKVGLQVKTTKADVGAGGAVARFQWILDNKVTIRPGDDLSLVILITNSYNYESKFELGVGHHRWICTNGLLSPALSGSQFAGKHTRRLRVEEAIPQVSRFISSSAALETEFRRWAGIELSVESFEEILVNRGDLPQKVRNQVGMNFAAQQQRTVWDAYNALTWYATHQTKGDRAVIRDAQLQHIATRFAQVASRN